MIRPRPMPPYLPIYPEEDRARIQAAYEQDDREWHRETNMMMWMNAIPVVVVAIGVAVAAIIGPPVIVDAIRILAQ